MRSLRTFQIESKSPITPPFEQIYKEVSTVRTEQHQFTCQEQQLTNQQTRQPVTENPPITMSRRLLFPTETLIVDHTDHEVSDSEISKEVSTQAAKKPTMPGTLQHNGHHQPKSLVVTLKLKKAFPLTAGFTPTNQMQGTSSASSAKSTPAIFTSDDGYISPYPSNAPLERLPRASHLPENHPTRGLAEAEAYYIHTNPPFVLYGSLGKCGRRPVYLVAINGKRPGTPIAAEIVCRSWNTARVAYWTLDVDDQRIIVKSEHNSGRIPGAKYVYHPWVGGNLGFGPNPIAFSTIGNRYDEPRARDKKDSQTNGTSASRNSEENFVDANSQKTVEPQVTGAVSPKPAKKRKPHHSPASEVSSDAKYSHNLDLPSTEYQVIPNTTSNNNELRGIPTLPPSRGWLDILEHQQSVFRQASERLHSRDSSAAPLLTPFTYCRTEPSMSPQQKKTKCGGLDGTEDTTSKGSDLADAALNGPRGRPRRATKPTMKANPPKPEVSNPRKRKANDDDWMFATRDPSTTAVALSSPLPSLPNNNPLPTPTSAQRPRHRPSSLMATVATSTNASLPPSLSPFTPHSQTSFTPITTSAPDTPESNMPQISSHKQRHTILRAACASSVSVVPLKLRSCMTIDSFFSTIITATGSANQEREISTIMVEFDFREEGDAKRSILVKRDVEDSFEVFLEMIDEAPCWEDEAGRCEVAVEVMLS